MNTEHHHETETPKPQRTTGQFWRRNVAGTAAAVAILSFAAGGYVFTERSNPSDRPTIMAEATLKPIPAAVLTPVKSPMPLDQTGQPFSFANLVEHVSPAVVTVAVEREAEAAQALPENIPEPFRDFFKQFGPQPGQPGQQGRPTPRPRAQAMGSGYIVDPTGYIVTNNHVVNQAKKISVKLADGREYTAKLVGTDKDTDVALLKVDNVKDLPSVAFGDDHKLRVGDWVVAVGNPFGLGGTVTAGIVSSIGRDIGNGPYTDFIQIDASINQGNSGGPTFDLTGRVIGMNTAIFSPSGGSVGIGFAIPATTVQAIVEQLKSHGSVTRGWLGVQIQNLTPDLASSLGVSNAKGAIVAGVVPDSPALKAGFRQGDVVTSLNGDPVADSRDLTRKVAGLRAGERVQFSVLRAGKPVNLTANIAKRDEASLAKAGAGSQDDDTPAVPEPAATKSSLGLSLSSISPAMRQQMQLDDAITGIVVTAVESESDAADKGFSPGDVITGIGNRDVKSVADVTNGIAEARKAGRDSVLLLVVNAQGPHYVAVKFGK